ncbi:MAG: alpha/beta hydrolase [Spirochaetota bacterium]|nr:alpha/beta hydrolase [Spirochaetota bacterium]
MDYNSGMAEINNTRINYEIAGTGPPLVLIHGFSLDLRMWDLQFETFSRTHRVLRYDVRGYGQSPAPEDNNYYQTDDLKGLMDYLDVPNAHVLGLSMGGGIALNFTLDYPDRVKSLFLVGSVIPGYVYPEQYLTSRVSLADIAQKEGVKKAIDTWLDQPLLRPAMTNPAVAPRLREIISDYSGHHWLHQYYGLVRGKTAYDRLHTIDKPTHILVGQHEAPHLLHAAEILFQGIDDTQKAILPDAGHILNMENPVIFNKALTVYLNDLD